MCNILGHFHFYFGVVFYILGVILIKQLFIGYEMIIVITALHTLLANCIAATISYPMYTCSASCRWNWPAENEVIVGWILANIQPVKNSKRFLGYACTNIWYLNHIQPPKWNVWNKFLTTLSISAILASKVIEINCCLSTCLMCSVSVYCACLPFCKHKAWSPAFKVLLKIVPVSRKKGWLALKILDRRLFS